MLWTRILLPAPPHRSALVPVLHASDLGTAKGLKKFKEGQKVAGKVLAVDAGAGRRGHGRGQGGACRSSPAKFGLKPKADGYASFP